MLLASLLAITLGQPAALAEPQSDDRASPPKSPAAAHLRPMPPRPAEPRLEAVVLVTVSDLRDPFAHLPRSAPPAPAAPPNDLKDPFAARETAGPPPPATAEIRDPFHHRGDARPPTPGDPTPLKDPFAPRQDSPPAAPPILQPTSSGAPPVQRPHLPAAT